MLYELIRMAELRRLQYWIEWAAFKTITENTEFLTVDAGTNFPDSPARRYQKAFGRLAGRRKEGWSKNAGEYLTGSADLHFIFPVLMSAAFTDGAIDKPAKISAFKLPGRAIFLLFGSTFFYSPACFFGVWVAGYPRHQEKHLSFHRRRNGTPTLLIAVNGFQGCSE